MNYKPSKPNIAGVLVSVDNYEKVFTPIHDVEMLENGLIRLKTRHEKGYYNLFGYGGWIPFENKVNRNAIVFSPSLQNPMTELSFIPDWIGRTEEQAKAIFEKEEQEKDEERAKLSWWKRIFGKPIE